MSFLSRIELAPLHRLGGDESHGVMRAERWAWDFVIDGRPLSTLIAGDIIGVLGWCGAAWDLAVTEKLLRRASPDLPPDRVALYVCPECGDVTCGAATASISLAGDEVMWQDFRWEGSPDGAGTESALQLGEFRFDRHTYERLLLQALSIPLGPNTSRVSAS